MSLWVSICVFIPNNNLVPAVDFYLLLILMCEGVMFYLCVTYTALSFRFLLLLQTLVVFVYEELFSIDQPGEIKHTGGATK